MLIRSRATRPAKIVWMAGAAGLALTAGAAVAAPRQGSVSVSASPGFAAAMAQTVPAKPVESDGLGHDGFYLEADEVTQDQSSNHVTAKGSVEVRYQGRVLRTDELDYQQDSGVVTARGHVQIANPDGTSQFADAITLDKDFSQGVAIGFATRLQDNVKIAAASAVRQPDESVVLRNAVYTPCDVCAENGRKAPTWSIRARKVVQDKKKQQIYYQDAVIQVLGVSLIYLPAFWTADPTVDRKSGFLSPEITYSAKRGITYEQPYYQVITKSQDVTITPQINTDVNPFLNAQWRRRFWSGGFDVRAGVTYEKDFDSDGDKFGDRTFRSYILSGGAFDIDENWRWGFTGERASDPLIFDKYKIGDVFRERGLYAADDRRLISQLFAIRQDENSYLSVTAISVQGLRPTDVNATFPTIAPLVEGRWEPRQPILGGRLRILGHAVILTRKESPLDPLLPGIDTRSATLQGDWQRTFIMRNGLRIEPFAQGRFDVYRVTDLSPPFNGSESITRGWGTAGVNISYPLIKQAGAITWLIEPMAQIAVSPDTKRDLRIPNEDSVVWEFDETNLFQVNKSPGFDLYEGGQRLNLGGRVTAEWGMGRTASVLLGRSFRTERDFAIPLRTGLQTKSSDWVFAAETSPIQGVNVFTRWRLDYDSLAVRRLEAGADFVTKRVEGYVRYLQEDEKPTGGSIKGLDFRGEVYATKNWGLTLYGIRDIEEGHWRRRDVGIVYRDECLRLDVIYRRDETFNRTLGPSDSVVVRLTLATLGNSGYRR